MLLPENSEKFQPRLDRSIAVFVYAIWVAWKLHYTAFTVGGAVSLTEINRLMEEYRFWIDWRHRCKINKPDFKTTFRVNLTVIIIQNTDNITIANYANLVPKVFTALLLLSGPNARGGSILNIFSTPTMKSYTQAWLLRRNVYTGGCFTGLFEFYVTIKKKITVFHQHFVGKNPWIYELYIIS